MSDEYKKGYKHGYADAMNWKVQNHLEHLPVAQPELTLDGLTPTEFALRELYEFQEATGCDTAAEFKAQPAVAEQHKQEPVACVVPHGATMRLEWASVDAAHNAKIGPLYTTPPQRKPLTDEEIGAILEGVNAYGTRLYTFARAIEAKLKAKNERKEKNNGS